MYLSDNKVKYILHHLKHHVAPKNFPSGSILILKGENNPPPPCQNKVIFHLSEDKKPDPVIINFHGTKIPILFGQDLKNEKIFHVDKKGNVIFHHDLLSSVFYLLSGQQEYDAKEKDQFGRFPYDLSIQKKLNCVHLPLVNYYFEIIIEGIEAHAQLNKSKIRRRKLFKNFGFFLSHDVDRIAFYHPFLVLYRIKQILGLSPVNYSKTKTINIFFRGVLFNINPFRGKDPWWNFDWIMKIEKRLGIRSTFFFLKREDRFDNSLYQFHHKKIKNLITTINSEGFEAGLHGTMKSAKNEKNLIEQKNEFEKATGIKPEGIRQHYLRFFHPQTFKNQQNAGFKYDTSLAFAEYDGYRNGYCWPFHPYDFDKDEMMKIWEIPLVMMEVSVLNYREAGFSEMKRSVKHHIDEAKKFGGIFSMLWHNCRINDIEVPGISEFYETLLKEIMQENPVSVRGTDIFNRISTFDDELVEKTEDTKIQ